MSFGGVNNTFDTLESAEIFMGELTAIVNNFPDFFFSRTAVEPSGRLTRTPFCIGAELFAIKRRGGDIQERLDEMASGFARSHLPRSERFRDNISDNFQEQYRHHRDIFETAMNFSMEFAGAIRAEVQYINRHARNLTPPPSPPASSPFAPSNFKFFK